MVDMTRGENMSEDEAILVLALKSVTTSTQQILKLKPGEYTIGRDPSCDIVIADPYISRKHAKIFYRDDKWYVEDLGSRNGTFVNGEEIRGRGPVELREGMEIVVGFSVIMVKEFERK